MKTTYQQVVHSSNDVCKMLSLKFQSQSKILLETYRSQHVSILIAVSYRVLIMIQQTKNTKQANSSMYSRWQL